MLREPFENVRGNAFGKAGKTDKQKHGVTHSESSLDGTRRIELTRTQGDMLSEM